MSQSKLLGDLTVFLPSLCWCARFGELTAIKQHWVDGLEVKKKQRWVDASELLLSETVAYSQETNASGYTLKKI